MSNYQISVIGTGDMGSAIAGALKERTPHRILVRGSMLGSISAVELAQRVGVSEATDVDIARSDIIFVVTPAKALGEIASTLKQYRGIVVSVAVSPTVGRDGEKSSAQRLAEDLPQARVVNALTSIWSDIIRNPGDSGKTSAFVCSDHEDAKKVIMDLTTELGFEAIDAGKISEALYAEVLGMLAVRLALDSGYGRRISFRVFHALAKN